MGPLMALALACIVLLGGVAEGRHMVAPGFRPTTIQSASLDGTELCEACQTLILEAQVVLTDPDNINAVVSLAESQLCLKLVDPQLVSKCREVVEEYVPALFQIMATEITPAKVCGAVCPVPPLFALAKHALAGREECQLCQYAATSLIAYLASNQTQVQIMTVAHTACLHVKKPELRAQCDAAVDEYVPQLLAVMQTITPAELCHILSFCPFEFGGPVANKDECLMCHFLVLELRFKLEQPETQAKVSKFLEETCNRIPNLTAQCTESIAEYAPVIFQSLDAVMDPRLICKKLHVCPRAVPLQKALGHM